MQILATAEAHQPVAQVGAVQQHENQEHDGDAHGRHGAEQRLQHGPGDDNDGRALERLLAGVTGMTSAPTGAPVSSRWAEAIMRSISSLPAASELTFCCTVDWYFGNAATRSVPWLPTTRPTPPIAANVSSTETSTEAVCPNRARCSILTAGCEHEGEQHRQHHGDQPARGRDKAPR